MAFNKKVNTMILLLSMFLAACSTTATDVPSETVSAQTETQTSAVTVETSVQTTQTCQNTASDGTCLDPVVAESSADESSATSVTTATPAVQSATVVVTPTTAPDHQ